MFSREERPYSRQCCSSQPLFLKEAELLNESLSTYDPDDLAALMKISGNLAMMTYDMIGRFGKGTLLEAIYAYRGTSFQSLNAPSLSLSELEFAQTHLRILSGMYGILKPLDLIYPYRLGMKTALPAGGCRNLAEFWGEKINHALETDPALEPESSVLINLASEEYSRLIDPGLLKRRMIRVSFKENTPSGLKTVGMYAKRARGTLLKRILQEKISDVYQIRELKAENYEYRSDLSLNDEWVFLK